MWPWKITENGEEIYECFLIAEGRENGSRFSWNLPEVYQNYSKESEKIEEIEKIFLKK